jgi:hypothetical protein
MRSDDAINEATALLRGTPVFMAGSCVAAQTYDNDGWSDLDLFVPTQQVLISTIQTLLNHGYTIDDRFDRVWHRWLRYGLKGWHTNSMRLHSINDVETNVVFKMVDGHPTTSLAQVLESFDFGLLGVGYDMESGQFRDMRPFLFPDHDVDGPLPLMPGKREMWAKAAKQKVQAFNFPEWLEQFRDDYVIVKCDIEGAEFIIFDKMLKDGTLNLMNELWLR